MLSLCEHLCLLWFSYGARVAHVFMCCVCLTFICIFHNSSFILHCIIFLYHIYCIISNKGLSCLWPHGCWIYNYLWNKCLSPLMMRARNPLRRDVLETTFSDKVCMWLVAGLWVSLGTPVSSTNKTDNHDIIKYCW